MNSGEVVGPATTAWYLRCTAEQVAERAVLVGDRGRVILASEILDDAVVQNEDRGLTVASGSWLGVPITVSAFGMGAPIAAIVLHELAAIGVQTAIRLGTVMAVGGTCLGDLVLADGALAMDGTSRTYALAGYPALADPILCQRLQQAAHDRGATLRSGLVASYDGFYTELFADPAVPGSRSTDFTSLAGQGVIGADMETAAILTVGRVLGVRTASLCLASVDAQTHRVLDAKERREAEEALLTTGFDALANDHTRVAKG